MGQDVDWKTTVGEAVATLQHYIRFNTTVPPGEVTEAADFLQDILEREGLTVSRYEASPGKINLYARLKGSGDAKPILLLHHIDVVPADASRWDPVNPFGGELKDGHIWGRGAIDMKGTGVLQLYAFLTLARQKIPLDRDVIFMAVNDEEIGGAMGTSYGRSWQSRDLPQRKTRLRHLCGGEAGFLAPCDGPRHHRTRRSTA